MGTLNARATGLDLTVTNAAGDPTVNKMTVSTFDVNQNGATKVAFKDMFLTLSSGWTLGEDSSVLFDNCEFSTGYITAYYANSQVTFRNSKGSVNGMALGGGKQVGNWTLWIDNSQLSFNNYQNVYIGNQQAGGGIRFTGANPVLNCKFTGNNFQSNLDNSDFFLEFEIPAEGFAEPPIQSTTATNPMFNDGKASRITHFKVAPTSPALKIKGTKDYPLVAWTSKGIKLNKCDFTAAGNSDSTFLYGSAAADDFGWQPVSGSAIATPLSIGVRIKGAASPDAVEIAGNPANYGASSPAYGISFGHSEGGSVTYSVDPSVEIDGMTCVCTGYVVSNVFDYLDASFATEGTDTSFSFTKPDNAISVTWQWARSFMLTVTSTAGGEVDVAEGLYAEGAEVTVTATPAEHCVFNRWTGDIGDADPTQPTITVTMDQVRSIRANFKKTIYVAMTGSDEADGLTIDTPLASVEKAVSESVDGDEIVIQPGDYLVTSSLVLDKGVRVRGATGNPEDVIIRGTYRQKTKVSFRTFVLDHREASVSSLTVEDAYNSGNYTYGTAFRIAGVTASSSVPVSAGGVVSNCVVRNSRSEGKFNNGLVYINSPNGLVTHCVITNNSTLRQGDSGGGCVGMFLHVTGGGMARECLIASNSNGNDGGSSAVACCAGSTIANCTVAKNAMTVGGDTVGGIKAADATAQVINCAVAGNTTKATNPASVCWGGEALAFVNCVFDEYAPNATCYAGTGVALADLERGDYHPTAASKCVDFGVTYGNMSATDLEGNVRKQGKAVDAGCYERDASLFSVGFVADVTSGFAPLKVVFTPAVSGVGEDDAVSLSWDFDNDGEPEIVTDKIEPVEWAFDAGSFSVSLAGRNLTSGKQDASTAQDLVKVGVKTLYVKAGNAGEKYPYATEETAAADIQTAIDEALEGAEVRIFDGEYQLANQLVLEKEITVCSDSGNPAGVIIRGGRQKNQTIRALEMNAGTKALIHSVTLADGYQTGSSNSGCVYLHTKGGTISNCVVTGGLSTYKFARAGGICANGANALITHCQITGNLAGAGFSDGANPNASAIFLTNGARCEHSLIARNGEGGSPGSGVGPAHCTVQIENGAVLSFCSIVSNAAYCVAGVSLRIDTQAENPVVPRIERCIISGNHSTHGDELGYNGAINGGKEKIGAEQLSRWHVWGSVVSYGTGSTIVERAANVVVGEAKAATATMAACFVDCLSDTVKINDSCKQESSEVTYRNLSRGRYAPRRTSVAVDAIAPASVSDMPAVDVLGKPRLQAGKYDLGAVESQSGGLLLRVK